MKKIHCYYYYNNLGSDVVSLNPPTSSEQIWDKAFFYAPDGYEVAECYGGTHELYDANGKHCSLAWNAKHERLELISAEGVKLVEITKVPVE